MPDSLRVMFALYGSNWSLSLTKGPADAKGGAASSNQKLRRRWGGVSEAAHSLDCFYHGTVGPLPFFCSRTSLV